MRSRNIAPVISFVVIISLITLLAIHIFNLSINFNVTGVYDDEKLHQMIFWRYLLIILDIVIISALIYILYRIIESDARPLHLTKEIEKKDKEYFDFLIKYQKDDNQTVKKQE